MEIIRFNIRLLKMQKMKNSVCIQYNIMIHRWYIMHVERQLSLVSASAERNGAAFKMATFSAFLGPFVSFFSAEKSQLWPFTIVRPEELCVVSGAHATRLRPSHCARPLAQTWSSDRFSHVRSTKFIAISSSHYITTGLFQFDIIIAISIGYGQ